MWSSIQTKQDNAAKNDHVFVVVVANFVQRFDFEVLYTTPEAN